MEKKGNLAANLSLSSPSSSFTQKWKYEVFLSFRGEETRTKFTSHLYAALRRKSINTFIDNKLRRGDEITPALMNVIEESNIGIIIFSDDYASSPFCLDEVAKMIECTKTHAQIVIPIFYHIDPSEVENQTGSFATAFAKHEIHNFDEVQRWKAALSKAASMAGWHIDGTSLESEIVVNIANDILKKLNAACSCDLNGLVGVKPRIKHIEALLLNESLDIRMLGIWGMGGIGKTTLAEAVFSQIKDQFEGCCFLPSVRINCEKDGDYIIKQLLFQISGEKDEYINSVDIRYSTSIARMLNIKALVVVDDVNSTQQLEFFLHNRHVFGRGSRIIVTSRDKHTLSWCCVDDIYEVNGLDFKEAQMFFYQSAFRKNFPAQEHSFLADLFITYANGNPLGLKILGSLLFGKNAREWKSAWDKLQKYPTEGIQNVLKISYDDLDKEERDIFLHLACFFRGERMNEVTKILNACGFNTDIALSVLIDKSLITIIETYSYHSLEMPSCLEMHDLLQEMGKGIVREESREPGKRSRLWDHGEIVRVLKENAGTGAIEAICLDMSKIDKIDLNPYVFKSMSSLKLLKFYDGSEEKAGKVHFPQGLECLPSELRYLYWHGYPLESLPSNFDPAELVELHLPYSMNIKSLQNFEVPQSSRLLKVPMLLGARNLVHINMYGCARIETFPSTIGLKSLETLNLTRCSKLATFPEVSSNVKSLDISYTAIKIVPATLGSLYRLEAFILINCIKLKHLSGSICKLKSLEMLELSGCLSLQHFPEISETMEHLKYLYLDGTAVEKLPSSIENLKNLHWLRLENCRNLIHLPKSLRNSTSLCGINLSGCLKLKKMPLLVSHCRYPDGGFILTSLSELSKQVIGLEATTCYLFRPVADESSLFSIVCLDLSGNRFEMLPSNIKNLYALRDLDISFCDKLRSLPDLPKSLIYLNANACGSLETSGIENLFHCHGDGVIRKFIFTNCLKLYETPWDKCNAGLDWTIELSSAIAIAPGHGVQQLCSARIIIDSGKNSPARNLTYTSMENSIKIPFSKHSNHCSFHDSETDLCLVINFPAYSILEPFKIYGVAKSKSHYLRKSIVIWSERKENLFSVKGSRDASLKIFLSPEDVDGLMLGSKTGLSIMLLICITSASESELSITSIRSSCLIIENKSMTDKFTTYQVLYYRFVEDAGITIKAGSDREVTIYLRVYNEMSDRKYAERVSDDRSFSYNI